MKPDGIGHEMNYTRQEGNTHKHTLGKKALKQRREREKWREYEISSEADRKESNKDRDRMHEQRAEERKSTSEMRKK